jgi:hypothetical protein
MARAFVPLDEFEGSQAERLGAPVAAGGMARGRRVMQTRGLLQGAFAFGGSGHYWVSRTSVSLWLWLIPPAVKFVLVFIA